MRFLLRLAVIAAVFTPPGKFTLTVPVFEVE